MKKPDLFDRPAVLRNRRRAVSDALFLHQIADDSLKERLKEVNRSFRSIAVVTGFPQFWGSHWPSADVVPDDEVLALEPAKYDLIIHAMCLHAANDPVGQLVQCRRAMQPDGLLLAMLFGGQTLHELRACWAESESSMTGGLSPRVAPMGEIRDLGGLLQRAGFSLPVADNDVRTVKYASAFALMKDLQQMGEGNALAGRARTFCRKTLMLDAVKRYADNFTDADGKVRATFEIVTLTGWAPAANQPKPLRRGSAQARLADALGADEWNLSDSKD